MKNSDFFWKEKDGVRILVSRALEKAGFVNGFSTRLGGVSPYPENDLNLAGVGEDTDANIRENRRRFLRLFPDGFKITSVWQIHGDGVKTVNGTEEASRTDEKFDALISNLPNLLAGVKTADCVPILIGDEKTRAFGAVHAGWRGTLETVVVKAVEQMKAVFGSAPRDLVCAIGPAAGFQRYEVGQEVVEAFSKKFSTGGKLFRETNGGHALIDLHLANRDQLICAGLREGHISVSDYCTMERTDLFFSYRIEKRKFGKTGRLMSVIGQRHA